MITTMCLASVTDTLIGGALVLAAMIASQSIQWRRMVRLEFEKAVGRYYGGYSCAYYAWKERETQKTEWLKLPAVLRALGNGESIESINTRYNEDYRDFMVVSRILTKFGNRNTRAIVEELENLWNQVDMKPDSTGFDEYEDKIDKLLDRLRTEATVSVVLSDAAFTDAL